MKLMLAILNDADAETALRQLIEAQFRVTRLASTGGFLRQGNTTFLMGMEAERIDAALDVLRRACISPVQPGQRRATVFVLDVDRFEQL